MDEVSPLLGNRLQESPEVLSPNLRPRHQDLLPTPCGPMKRWSELTLTARIYFCLIMVSLLVLFGLTVPTYQQRTDPHLYNEDFAVSIIQLMGVLFCIYYISRGVLQENKLELVVFVLSLLVVMVRSLINFIVVGPEGRKELLLCLCILITASDGGMSATYTAVLAVGVAWACLTAAVGAIAVLKEAKGLVWIFMVQNLLQLAFCGYLTYTVVKRWFTDQTYTNEAAAVSGSLLSLVIKAVLLWGLVKLLRSFRH
ncbi:uncharacterized protein LOC112138538 isoform X3 [Oryzias melastigma]|uniref:uncharacterized protein LOC112138538 isoform X3 n=1 Tax=Oryzias melastigma TaxID=30732 RepID=UPI000CF7B4F5|nr:uncharacterized protein LOC112138538 isoform X3 [Oryzias melastigma]